MHASARLGARAGAPARLALSALPSRPRAGGRAAPAPPRAYTVKLTHAGVEHTLSVSGDESILEVALDAGIDVPHDCKARRTLLHACALLRSRRRLAAAMRSGAIRWRAPGGGASGRRAGRFAASAPRCTAAI